MGSSKSIWKKVLIGVTITLCMALIVSVVAIHDRAAYYRSWGVKETTAVKWAKEDFKDLFGIPTEIESRDDILEFPMANANIEW